MDGFFGIEIARRALQTNQSALDVTAHNIANANTPGYSRQRAVLGTTEPFPAPYWNRPLISAQLGTGVQLEAVERMRDSYFDDQLRRENQSTAGWQIKDNAMKQIETIFNEPSDTSLLNLMGEFWNAWQQLSKNPESLSIRSNVVETGRTLATSFNQLDDKLTRLQASLNDQVMFKVTDINSKTQKILSLNQDIAKMQTYGAQPNDLMDQRDQLIDDLSKMADIQVTDLASGAKQIFLGGRLLVGDTAVNSLNAYSNPLNNGYYDVTWAVDGTKVNINAGEIKSLTDARDVTVKTYRGNLDTLASNLVTGVNNLHSAGYGLDNTTGWNFFNTTGTTAKTIAISSDVSNLSHVAAAASGGTPATSPGDNGKALLIAQLKENQISGLGNITMDDYYRSIVTNYGIASQESGRMVANGKLYTDLIDKHRQSVSGVSLDEEASNMIKYQKAYEAAAKVISTYDEMLDVIINGLIRH